MLHVAFFRNMNLGQTRSKSPTRTVLEDAFVHAGATSVRSFQTNGTVVFDPMDDDPFAVVERARARLNGHTGYDDIAPALPVPELKELLRVAREAGGDGLYATLFAAAPTDFWPSGAALDGGTVVVGSGPGWLVTRVTPGGDPTSAVQKKLGRKATTRGVPTIERLIRSLPESA